MSGLRIGPSWRVVSPSGGSTLMTSAPRSPSCCAAQGPSTTVVQSTTRTPVSGPDMLRIPLLACQGPIRAGAEALRLFAGAETSLHDDRRDALRRAAVRADRDDSRSPLTERERRMIARGAARQVLRPRDAGIADDVAEVRDELADADVEEGGGDHPHLIRSRPSTLRSQLAFVLFRHSARAAFRPCAIEGRV